MRFRPVILVWFLLFGATLCMAAAAWWLLGREADRVESLAAGTLANRTASVAESIDLLMEEVRDGVAEGLLAVSEVPEPRVALAELVGGNPYLSAGFYFRGSDGVTVWYGERGNLPSPRSLREGKGYFPWTLPEFEPDELLEKKKPSVLLAEGAQSNAPSDVYAMPSQADLADDYTGDPQMEAEAVQQEAVANSVAQNLALKRQRAAVRKVNVDQRVDLSSSFQSLSDLLPSSEVADAEVPGVSESSNGGDAKKEFGKTPDSLPSAGLRYAQTIPVRHGWATAELEGRQQWMAWSGLPESDNFIGVWLHREAIIAELAKAISLSQQDGLRFRLVGAKGEVIAGESGSAYGSLARSAPEQVLAVGSALPQWRIETFRAHGANTFGSSFRLLGGLFIVGLSFAILLGSTVLIWQARRDALDAERKTTFVANVSHELRTPLTSIRLFADMLYDGRVKDAAKQREYLQTMVNETQRLTRLVNNVLDFSRLERGSRRANRERVNVGDLVSSIVETQRERLRADGLELNDKTPSAPLEVELDPDALEQILLNLLDNAAKYASSGQRADVIIEQQEGAWSLIVRDYGPGVPPSEKKRIFQAFQRIDDRLTSERPGCGLGLSIAARLAGEMGGTLTLEDSLPGGCSFILKING